jgi:O-antigen/teichoic acid export membrane protein
VGPLDVTGAFLATVGSVGAMCLALTFPLLRYVPLHHEEHARRLRDLLRTAWAPLLALALVAVLQNIDVIVVKHGASDDDASSYAAAAVAGKGIIWVAVGVALFLVPETARRAHAGEKVSSILLRTLGIIAVVAVPMVAVYTVAGEPLLSAVFGSDLTEASDALPWIGFAMAMLSAVYLAVQYMLALGRSAFLAVLAVAAILEPLLLSAVSSQLTEVGLVLAGLQAVLAVVILSIALSRRTASHELGRTSIT